MKRLLIASVFALTCGAANAADIAPVYRKAPVAPAASWNGFYAGLNVGYGYNDPGFTFAPNDAASALFPAFPFGNTYPPVSYDVKGALGGGQAGYNWQVSPNWLVGIEADFQKSDINGSGASRFLANGTGFNAAGQQSVDWFGTLRLRAGWLANDKLLVYGTGGLAYGQVNSSASLLNGDGVLFGTVVGGFQLTCAGPAGNLCATGATTKVQTGYSAGGGLEYAFWQNMTLKAEYLYVNLGRSSALVSSFSAQVGFVPSTLTANFSDLDFHVARVGVNYRF